MIFDILQIIVVFVIRLVVVLAGLIVVPVAMLWRRETGEALDNGWRRVHLPAWAWAWDNEADGMAGDKAGDYARRFGGGYWALVNWAALRNPANNFSRYKIGIARATITDIRYRGTDKEPDEGVIGWAYYRAETVSGSTYPCFVWSGAIGSRMVSAYAGWKIRKRHLWQAGPPIGFTVVFEIWGKKKPD